MRDNQQHIKIHMRMDQKSGRLNNGNHSVKSNKKQKSKNNF